MPALRALALVIVTAVAGLVAAPAAQAAPRTALEVTLDPGDAIFSDGGSCLVGAYATNGTTNYIVTASACGEFGDTWYADSAHTVLVGTGTGGFPSTGGLIALAPGVTPVHAFSSAGDAYVGETVCTLTPVDGTVCGTVVALNVSVSTPEGTIWGLIQINRCVSGGMGAPLFDGGTLLGIQPFGSSCTSGSTAFFQPATDILQSHGVTLY